MNQSTCGEKAESGRLQDLSLPDPGGEEHQKGHHIDHHARIEGLSTVEEEFPIRMALRIGPGGKDLFPHLDDSGIEARWIA